MLRHVAAAAAVLWAGLATGEAAASPVLLISLDGLRPGDVAQAKARGLKLPELTALAEEGASAEGVIGVLPTLTYPSHTTLLTGVSPARHGVSNNLTFDPDAKNQTGWYWYASDVRVPTLWAAAHAKGLKTANVHWPVSVGAPGIDLNLPQIWRTGTADDAKLLAALATPGLMRTLEKSVGEPYAQGIDESVEGDANRVRFAAAILAAEKMVYRGGCILTADEIAAPLRTMPGSGSSLTSCIEGRSKGNGAFRGSGRFGEGDVGVRGGRCRQGGVRA